MQQENDPTPAELRDMRTKAGLTTRELGFMVGVSAATISRYERGTSRPSKLVISFYRTLADTEPRRDA